MAKIALRAYNTEVGEMVDHGQIDEAIAHCRHILQTFPRHVDTYRLLGKAYLEGQRYGDAADILQRVLSSVPEDFIAHVGMSIIREDEGNMDAAIWHMERAFEGQPSNQAIQDELRRLYGRRDGREPARIRLTRGALARMYAHGHLYDQAVAELQAALTEDPQRPDLQALLAEMYAQTGKKAEAAEACMKILAKLPNCLVANRLLAQLLEGNQDRNEERDTVRKRWIALDPYAAHRPAADDETGATPEDVVSLDHLDYDPASIASQPGAAQPGWASSLGVDLGSQAEESAPDWLSAGAGSGSLFGSRTEEESASIFDHANEDEGAGAAWGSFGSGETAAAEEPADWLNLGDSPASEPAAEDDSAPDWLSAAAPAAAEEPAEETPDWLNLGEEAASEPEQEDDSAPDWLSAAAPAAAEEPAEETPDWLNLGEEAADEPGAAGQETAAGEEGMSWLGDLTGEPAAETAGDNGAAEDALPDFLKEAGWEPGSGAAEEPTSLFDEAEDEASDGELAPGAVPDWMKQLQPADAAGEDDDFAAALSKAAETSDEAPGWGDEPAAPGDNTLASFLEETQPTGAGEDDDWLQRLAAPEPQGDDAMPPTPTDDGPDWLKDLGNDSPSSGSDDDDLESMDWLDSLTEDVGKQLDEEAAAASAAAPPPAPPAADDDLESMDWLDSLTEDVGKQLDEEAAAASAAAPPPAATPVGDDDLESMDWLDSLTDEVGSDLRAEAASQAQPSAESDDDEMAWLQKLGDDTGSATTAAPAAGEDDLESMDWLDSLTDEVGSDLRAEAAGQAAPPEAADDSVDDALAWMESLAAKQGAAEEGMMTRPETRSEEVPDWVREAAEAPTPPPSPKREPTPSKPEAPPERYQPAPPHEVAPPAGPGTELSDMEGMDDALAWLEGLASEQGADEVELITQPERRTGELPKWALEEKEDAEPPAEPAAAESGIGWLDDLTAEAAPAEANAAEDWLKQIEQELPSLPPESAGAEGAPPSWLDEITNEGAIPSEEATPVVPEWLHEVADPKRAPEPVGEQPEWLPDLKDEAESGEWVQESAMPDEPAPEPKPEPVAEPAAKAAPPTPPAEPEAARPTPVRTPGKPRAGTAGKTDDIRIAEARQLMSDGEVERSAAEYAKLVSRGKMVDEVITDLREALRRHPVDVSLWQALGDAYTRQDLLQEAMDAYTKAEDLLRF